MSSSLHSSPLVQLGDVSLMSYNILAGVWTDYVKVNDASDVEKEIREVGADVCPDHIAKLVQLATSLRQEAVELLDEKTRIALVTTQILRHKPDILLLQEAQTSSVELLRSLLFDNYVSTALAKNVVTSAPQANGTIAFMSLTFVKRLSSLGLSIHAEPMWLECGSVSGGSDGSSAQLLSIETSSGKPLLTIVNIHLEWGLENRVTQLEVLRGALNTKLLRYTPIVIAGDFNAIKSEVQASLKATGFPSLVAALGDAEPTTFFSGSDPTATRQCDHVYMSRELTCIDTLLWDQDITDLRSALKMYGSDHIPVTVTLRVAANGNVGSAV